MQAYPSYVNSLPVDVLRAKPAFKFPSGTSVAEFEAKHMRPIGPAVSPQPVVIIASVCCERADDLASFGSCFGQQAWKAQRVVGAAMQLLPPVCAARDLSHLEPNHLTTDTFFVKS